MYENGIMDSVPEVANSDHVVMDFNNKSVKHSSFALQSNSCFVEHTFVNCNGNSSSDHDTSILMNGVDDEEVKKSCNNTNMKNSSQRSISIDSEPVCSLETKLSNLSITKDDSSNHTFNQVSKSTNMKCDKLYENSGRQEPNNISISSDETKLMTDVHSDTNLVLTDDISSRSENNNNNNNNKDGTEIMYICYESENQMPDIMKLIQKDLSEPYSIYTYRYFIHNWPQLCFLATCKGKSVGAIVCKLDIHRKVIKRGYIAMLAVDECYRKHGIGSNLVLKAIRVMAAEGADEVVLETEITNHPALRLYENLGFVRDKRLFRYYLNGVDALRLKLWLK